MFLMTIKKHYSNISIYLDKIVGLVYKSLKQNYLPRRIELQPWSMNNLMVTLKDSSRHRNLRTPTLVYRKKSKSGKVSLSPLRHTTGMEAV
jgi:hypothetical protein